MKGFLLIVGAFLLIMSSYFYEPSLFALLIIIIILFVSFILYFNYHDLGDAYMLPSFLQKRYNLKKNSFATIPKEKETIRPISHEEEINNWAKKTAELQKKLSKINNELAITKKHIDRFTHLTERLQADNLALKETVKAKKVIIHELNNRIIELKDQQLDFTNEKVLNEFLANYSPEKFKEIDNFKVGSDE